MFFNVTFVLYTGISEGCILIFIYILISVGEPEPVKITKNGSREPKKRAVLEGAGAGKPFLEGVGAESRQPVKKVLAPQH